jgi:hypothetical protein
MKKSKGVSKFSCGSCRRLSQRFQPVALKVHGGLERRLNVSGAFSSGAFTRGAFVIGSVVGLYRRLSVRHLVGGRPTPRRLDSTSVFHCPCGQLAPDCWMRRVVLIGKVVGQVRLGVKAY